MIEHKMTIDGFTFSLDSQQLVIENLETLNEAIAVTLTREKAAQLSAMLSRVAAPENDARAAFRVPVLPHFGLATKMSDENSAIIVETRNLSTFGMNAKWISNRQSLETQKGQSFNIEFGLDDFLITVEAVVIRVTEGGLALAFCNPEPTELTSLVMELQRAWIATVGKDPTSESSQQP